MKEIRMAENYKGDFWVVARKDYMTEDLSSKMVNFQVRHKKISEYRGCNGWYC